MRPLPAFAGITGPLIIAHRGGSLEAPENTVAAVAHGIAAGADWQEIDVTLSADDVPIVIHDDTVNRTTDGKGAVADMAAHTLTALHAGRPRWSDEERERLGFFGVEPPDFGDRFEAARVPTLDDILAVPGARLMIELKKIDPRRTRLLAQKAVDAVGRAQAWDRVIIGSFATDLLWAVHDIEPSFPLLGIVSDGEAAEKMLALPLAVLGVRFDVVAEVVKVAPPRLAIWSWTAYSVEMAQAAIEAGAHGVITDVPAAVIETLRAPPDLYIQ